MGPLHCPLCIGLALLSILRTAAYGILLLRLAGFAPAAAAQASAPIRGSLLVP